MSMFTSQSEASLFILVVDHPSSDIIERLTEKKIQKHQEALKQLDSDLSQLSQVQYIVVTLHLRAIHAVVSQYILCVKLLATVCHCVRCVRLR